MDWLRAHSYLVAAFCALAVFSAGVFIVVKNTPVASTTGLIAWSGSGTALNLGIPAQGTSGGDDRQSIMQQVQSGAPYSYVLPVFPAASQNASSDSFDFDAFLSMLSGGAQNSSADTPGSGSAEIGDAYAFIPSGLISTDVKGSARTKTQQVFFDYGNDIGSYIQSFELEHRNTPRILKDHAEDRADPAKSAALESLGNELASLGDAILAIGNVPQGALAAHKALGQSYEEIGGKLALVARAHSDADFVAAIQTYNAAADTFIKNYVALALLFSAYGVTFSSEDAGSVFTFNSGNF